MPDALTTIEELARLTRLAAMKAYMQSGEVKTYDVYRRQLWRAALGLFRGEMDEFGFIGELTTIIEGQLTRAWNEGARSVDVDPQEMTQEDLFELARIIQNEYEFVLRLANDIVYFRMNAAEDANFSRAFRSRIDTWANRYNETVNNARIWFDKKIKLKWVQGATEEGCGTCAALDGIVAFAGEWEQSKLRPQNPPNNLLGCGGWKCACRLEPTTERRTRRALDRLISIALTRAGGI